MKINLTMADTAALEKLAYWPMLETTGNTKPRTRICPFCGKKNAVNAIEMHNAACLVEAAQHEYERRQNTSAVSKGEP